LEAAVAVAEHHADHAGLPAIAVADVACRRQVEISIVVEVADGD
jgi:hypothetical protein